MKATGIVRRIDDLGRVVIPKEIRRSMRIREGDPIEFFTDRECLCLRKYSPEDDFKSTLFDFLRLAEDDMDKELADIFREAISKINALQEKKDEERR